VLSLDFSDDALPRIGEPLLSFCFIIIPALPVPPPAVGGVPLLDPPPFPRDEEEDTVRMADVAVGPVGLVAGIGGFLQNVNLARQPDPLAALSLSSLLRSNAAR
jgi:hypothetical protein